MGFTLSGSGSVSCFEPTKKEKIVRPFDPTNYEILRHWSHKEKYLVVEIQYRDCENYEGRKVMVFECSLQQLKDQKAIDPHFLESKKFHSPIARFEPTPKGWKNAVIFVHALIITQL
jgi:hypothetical protein